VPTEERIEPICVQDGDHGDEGEDEGVLSEALAIFAAGRGVEEVPDEVHVSYLLSVR
jgi:hypothetical protein